MLANPGTRAPLLGRLQAPGTNGIPPGIPKLVFVSYMLIPLSSIMFPHMAIMCLTAKKVQEAFKKMSSGALSNLHHGDLGCPAFFWADWRRACRR